MQLGNGPRHDVRNKIRVKEHSMHKEQIHTLQQLQRRHVTCLAREPYCDSVGLLLSFWIKCTVYRRVFCSSMFVLPLRGSLDLVNSVGYDNDKGVVINCYEILN